MSEKEQLKIQAEEIKAQMEKLAKEIADAKNDNSSNSQEKAPSDEQEDTRPIFTIPNDIDAEAPHFEKVHRDTDDEHESMGDKESRKSIAELEAELEKTRLNYFKKAQEQNKIKIISKALLHKITAGKYKPDFVKAKSAYEATKGEFIKTKYSEKVEELEKDIFKSKEEKERELADFKADILVEESSRMWDMEDARLEALSERRKALYEKVKKATLNTWNTTTKGYGAVMAADKKLFHRGPILIDKRGEKPANADDLNRQAKANDDQIERLEIALKKEKLPEEKDRLKKEIKSLQEMSRELKDQAKGEIIYQYRLGQLARTTAIFATGGGFVAGGAGVAMLGLKIARSVGIGMGGAYALARNEKALQSKLHDIKTNREKLESDFAGRTAEKDYTEAIKKLERKELMTKIVRNTMKVVIIGLMAGVNYASGQGERWVSNYTHGEDITETVVKTENENISEQTNTPEETAESAEPNATENTRTVDEAPKTAGATDEVIKNVETVVSGEGSLATIDDLKDKLSAQFGDDLSKAPAHIRHIIETDKYTLGKEWGLFNPDDPSGKESAMMLKGSNITMDKNWNITLHNVGKGDTVLSGEGAKVYTGEMFNSNGVENGGATKLGEGEVDINQIPEGEEGYTKLTEGEVDINQNPEGLDPNNLDKAPYADGLPVDENKLNKTVWEKNDIKIRSGAYEDANGNIVRLEGKDVTLGADHKIYVDGVVSEELTDKLNLEKSKLLDKTFTTMFGWSNDGAKSPEWLRLQKYDMGTLKNPPTEGFLNDRENNFVKKLLKQAAKTGIDYHGKTASQLVEEIAIKKLG